RAGGQLIVPTEENLQGAPIEDLFGPSFTGPDWSDMLRPVFQRSRTGDEPMIRLSRITDYGIVLMAHLAACPPGAPHNARELAAETRLPLPVVSKVLKAL